MADQQEPEERPMITFEPTPDAEVKATQTSPPVGSSPLSAPGETPTQPAVASPPFPQPWTPRSPTKGAAASAGGATASPQAPRKSVTVADVTSRAEAQELHRQWAHEHFLESVPVRESHMEASRRERLVKTAQTFCIHLSFFGMGMYYALFGPTVQDLAVTLDVGLFRVLFLLAARGVGYFLGAVAGGVLLRPVNPQVLLVVLDFFLAMACLGVSYFDTLFQSELLFGLGGFALGAINIVGVLWMSALWREASGFLLQTLSFMHCMGCTLAPVLGEPFLTQRSVLRPPSDMPPAVERELAYLTSLEDKDFVYVAYAYWAVALYVFAVVFLVLVAFFVDPRHQDLRAMETQCPVAPCSGIVVVLFSYLFTSVAMEIIYSQLVAAFALLLGQNKTVAAYLTSSFWAAFSAVRGASIVWLQQHGSLGVLLCSNVLLLALAGFGSAFGHQAPAMWIGAVLAGASMAPVMPSTLLLLHDHSGVSRGRFALAVLVVGASSAFAPLCLGAEMEREPMLFHYALAALAGVSLLLLLVARMLVRRGDGYAPLPAAVEARSYKSR
ncbi:sodium-dependent glucose transporter 1-like isoform X2 [Dermacentor andersoni]|uniref:sodium-dependent glucose transporter 1-like isoform X2 n=1 Tax=Dermacentor andersoni TaxID=34620 RepID=UPI002415CB99|nr:sodium-dependent glucose transporter 1-like isoform X2 [Dermacentor andersoni]